MSYTRSVTFNLGTASASRPASGIGYQLINSDTTNNGTRQSGGAFHLGQGQWGYIVTIPDGFSGWCKGDDGVGNISPFPINPGEDEQTSRIHGLLGGNIGIRNMVYIGSLLLSYDICLYNSAVNAALNDGATGLIGKYSVTNTWDNSNLETETTVQVT